MLMYANLFLTIIPLIIIFDLNRFARIDILREVNWQVGSNMGLEYELGKVELTNPLPLGEQTNLMPAPWWCH